MIVSCWVNVQGFSKVKLHSMAQQDHGEADDEGAAETGPFTAVEAAAEGVLGAGAGAEGAAEEASV